MESEGGVIQNAGMQVLDVYDNNARQYQTMNDEHRQNPQCDSQSECIWGRLGWSYRRQLLHLSKYRMCQQITVVNQPLFSVVLNMADNALDGFDISGVQGSNLWVRQNWQQPIHIGGNSLNLLNNSQVDIVRLLHFKFFALGNGDGDDVQKLPEERL